MSGPKSSTSSSHMASAIPSSSSQWTPSTLFIEFAARTPAPPVNTA